ncbi:MAG: phenylacetic acid degradation protein PaaN [Acidimicrobiia bacterium]|nr:phenylacetic acid degradation protein PaaN [Acidimicrobiia bacterium]
MADRFFDAHRETLEAALEAIASRGFWSPYPEHPKDASYGEDAAKTGQQAFESRLGRSFELDQPGVVDLISDETSPYGTELGVTYPRSSVNALVTAAGAAGKQWGKATPQSRAGVCLEILHRLNRRSHEMAAAVMHTTGQSFVMSFQAGGPHAQDRGLEALAYAYAEMSRVPSDARWEKPQGSRDPIVLDKTYRIIPRGVGAVIGCSTFPTWNSYSALFADLATGNAVVVKPHPATVLPLAITVEIAREVLTEAGFDPNVVTLLVDTVAEPVAKDLVMDSRVKLVDYTGGSAFGDWLEQNVHHASVYTEKAGVNSVLIDSTDDIGGLARNLSISLSMYSGQMCTAPQTVFVAPEVETDEGTKSFDEVVELLANAVGGLVADDARAAGILGAIKSPDTVQRILAAQAEGDVRLESRAVADPNFPDAIVRTPAIVVSDRSDTYGEECFGPVVFVVPTESTDDSIAKALHAANARGAISWLVYSTDEAVIEAATEAAAEAGVSTAINLTGGVFVNQNAAFSDFHVTGANPAGNASLADPAYVANRFRVAQVRRPAA